VATVSPAPRIRSARKSPPDRDRGSIPSSDFSVRTCETFDLIALLNPHLDDAELVLLSHAVDNQEDVLISYQDKNGSHTVRQVRPHQLHDRWLDSVCYLRNADREFTVADIESVAPAS